MAKRKCSNTSTASCKKPRLDDPDTIPNSTPHVYSPLSLMSLLMAPEPLKKRKRSDNPEAESKSPEEPKARRIKTSDSQTDQTRYSRSSSPSSQWSILSYSSREEDEGPDPEVEAFRKAYREAIEEGPSSQSLSPPNPLPSPEPSDRDVTERDGSENDELGFLIITPTPKPSRLFSRQHPKRRSAIPPHRKRRQPPNKGKDKNERNKPRDDTPQSTIEAVYSSKRSSRRDPNLTLWQLGDDGSICEVSKAT